MMKQEFERLAGYEVSENDYNKIIEPMYMATDLDKIEFVNTLDRKRFEVKREKTEEQKTIEAEINKEIALLKEDISWYEQRVKMIEEYEDDYFIAELERVRNEIKILKNRIKTLKWVLA